TVHSGQLAEPRTGAPFAHRDRVPRAVRGRGKDPVAGGEEALRYAEGVDERLRYARQRTGHRSVHVEHQRGGPVAAGQLVRHAGVRAEAGLRATEPFRDHESEQSGLPQVGEVVDRERTVAVVPRRTLGEPGHQPPRGRHHIGHDASLVPTPWYSTAVMRSGTMRTSPRRVASQRSIAPTCGRNPLVRNTTPCRAHSSTSARRSTNRFGSWMPCGATPGSRSASVTATNRLNA